MLWKGFLDGERYLTRRRDHVHRREAKSDAETKIADDVETLTCPFRQRQNEMGSMHVRAMISKVLFKRVHIVGRE